MCTSSPRGAKYPATGFIHCSCMHNNVRMMLYFRLYYLEIIDFETEPRLIVEHHGRSVCCGHYTPWVVFSIHICHNEHWMSHIYYSGHVRYYFKPVSLYDNVLMILLKSCPWLRHFYFLFFVVQPPLLCYFNTQCNLHTEVESFLGYRDNFDIIHELFKATIWHCQFTSLDVVGK